MDLLQRLHLLEAVLDTLGDALSVTDASGAVVFCNALARAASAPRGVAQSSPLTIATDGGAAAPSLTLHVYTSVAGSAVGKQADLWTPGALPGLVTSRLHPDDAAAALAFSQSLAAAAPDAVRHHDCRLRSADGTFRWTRCTASALRDDSGAAAAQWLASAVDIQDLRDAEQALSADQALLTAVVDELPVAVGVIAVPSGRSIVCNRKCMAMFPGFSDIQSTAAFDGYRDMYDAAGNVAPYEEWPLIRAMRGEHVTGEALDEALPTGGKRRLRVHAAPVHAADGTIIAATFSAEDMTYAVQVEEERALRHATSQLLSTASHELRTPLNGIVGFSELLSHSPLTDEQHEQLQCISECSNVLLRCVNDLLAFNKLTSDTVELEAVPMRIAAVVNTCALILQPQATAKGVRLDVRVGHLDDVVVIGDPERFKQIVCNLLSNALKFTPADGSITIEGSVIDDAGSDDSVTLRFQIIDTGIGIAATALSRIWTPFAQADSSTTRKYGGTGLGLSIVRRLAALMNGEAGVSSVVGTGSTFWFTAHLPKGSNAMLTVDAGAGAASVRLPMAAAAPSTAAGPHTLQTARMPVLLPLRVPTDAETTRSRSSTPSVDAEATTDAETTRSRSSTPSVDAEATISPMHALMTSPATPITTPAATSAGALDCATALAPPAVTSIRAAAAAAVAAATGLIVTPGRAALAISTDPRAPVQPASPASTGTAAALVQHAPTGGAASGAAVSAFGARAPLLLVAEDNATNILVMKRMLQRLGLANIMFVNNGQEAVDAVASRDVDLVLMDCHMDVMDGYEACRAIRSMAGPKASTPVIAVTASSMEEDRRACEAAGMSCFLSKPMTLASLTSALQHCLPPRSAPAAADA